MDEADSRSRADVERVLSSHVAAPVRVTFTDNGRVMLSSRRRDGFIEARVHHMFARADDETLAAVAQYLRRRTSRAARVLDAFIATHSDAIRVRARTVTLRHRGTHHDLALMFHELNEAWFESKVDARITWGAVPAKKRRRSIRLGTYAEREHLIRIHPALDQAWVPDYVVRTVVHHEMLHAALPAVIVGDRKIFHTREFRRRERAFPEFERATAWEDANIDRLLRGISR